MMHCTKVLALSVVVTIMFTSFAFSANYSDAQEAYSKGCLLYTSDAADE